MKKNKLLKFKKDKRCFMGNENKPDVVKIYEELDVDKIKNDFKVEVKQEKPKKKKKFKGFFIFLLLIIIGVGGYFLHQSTINTTITEETEAEVEVEILDDSVLADEVLKEWVSENQDTKGHYETEYNDSIYVLISHGKTTKPGVGVCLESIEGSSNVDVTYSFIPVAEDREVEEYIPKMILKLNKASKVNLEEIQYNK